MKNSVLSLIALVLFSTSIWAAPGGNEQEKFPTIDIGTKLPAADSKMKDISGNTKALKDYSTENGLLVVFSCNTCPFVVYWEDRYPALKKLADELKVGIVMINSNEMKRGNDDSYEAMQAHAKDKNYNWPYLLDKDSKVANAMGAKTTPHVFLFDKDLKLVYKGAIDDNYEKASEVKEHYLENAMRNMSTGKKIEPNTTKPVGCSVKRVI